MDIHANLESVQKRIKKACRKSGRQEGDVRLVAVTKTVESERILQAIDAGIRIFGENYIQEAREKIESIGTSVSWHFIGRLQTNKAKYAVRYFDMIHSVDSLKLAAQINSRADKENKIQEILVQVNLSGEKTKAGFAEDRMEEILSYMVHMHNLRVSGLMTMPPFFNEPEMARPFFRRLKTLLHTLQNRFPKEQNPNITLCELSMGMTGDFSVAVEEGATLVRIGTAIFGERK